MGVHSNMSHSMVDTNCVTKLKQRFLQNIKKSEIKNPPEVNQKIIPACYSSSRAGTGNIPGHNEDNTDTAQDILDDNKDITNKKTREEKQRIFVSNHTCTKPSVLRRYKPERKSLDVKRLWRRSDPEQTFTKKDDYVLMDFTKHEKHQNMAKSFDCLFSLRMS